MALPLIGLVLAGSFVKNMMDADSNNERATRINLRAINGMGEAARKAHEQEEKTKQSLLKLANRKCGILKTTMKNFIDIYEKIIKINFKENEAFVKAGNSLVNIENLNEIKHMTTVAGISMSSQETIGTMLFRGYGFMGGISGVIAKESEINISVAKMRKRQADVIAAQSETIELALEAVHDKAECFSQLLAKLNLLFMKSIQQTSTIIERNGINKKNYTEADKAALMNCINVAGTMKDLFAAPLFDETGEMSKQGLAAIQIGEKYLGKINQAIK